MWSEISAIVGILVVIVSALAWLLRAAGDRRYLQKAAFYAQRDRDAKEDAEFQRKVIEALEAVKTKVAAIETEQSAAAAPMQSLNKSVGDLVTQFGTFQTALGEWRVAVETRIAVIADRQTRPRSRRGDGGR